VSHTSWTLLSTWCRESIQVPTSLTHVATCGPCMRVSTMNTFRIGELRPGTLEFARKYPSKLLRKVRAFFLSLLNTWGRFPITVWSASSLVGDVDSALISASVGSVSHCLGLSSSLESGDLGLSRVGSSLEDLIVASCSDGRLSPSKLWMSTLATPRYGFPEVESCSSSCQRPVYKVTALVFFPDFGGGLNKRTLYPRLFLWSSVDMKVIRSFVICADFDLLRAMCVSSSQTRVLLVSLELAVVEKE
jgi:hypothetical protein